MALIKDLNFIIISILFKLTCKDHVLRMGSLTKDDMIVT
jgi:hypothetical protein